ncbi:MAG: YsnF/AvaK domain-containing protein [Bacteroidota bacterium]
MSQTVVSLFDNASEAQQAVEELVEEGFTRDQIDVSAQSDTSTAYNQSDVSSRKEDKEDGIGKFFSSIFNSADADKYSTVARRSGSIVTVHAQSKEEAHRAAEILDDCGAIDVEERANEYGYASKSGTLDTASTTDKAVDNTTSLPIIEESIHVGKRVVESGGARLRSRIVETPVEESLRLRYERVRVERTPVDRPATEADFTSFQEGTIELTERNEVPVISKEARVVEEVSLNREVEEREETIRDTVRHTEVDVENINRDDSSSKATDLDDDLDESRERGRDF